MSGKGVSIRKMKEILRLYYDANLAMHQIARSLNLSSGAVCNHLSRLKKAGITWPIPEGLSDQDLANVGKTVKSTVETIEFSSVQKELKRTKGVTLQLLWDEYHDAGLIDLSYSQFCRRFKKWQKRQPQSMKQTHVAGDKVFILRYLGWEKTHVFRRSL